MKQAGVDDSLSPGAADDMSMLRRKEGPDTIMQPVAQAYGSSISRENSKNNV